MVASTASVTSATELSGKDLESVVAAKLRAGESNLWS
jgi:hypothetical protein